MMTVYDELLEKYPQAVYIGEDVTHGGYYLVTDGLAKKYPRRVADFPPEETALLGAAIGYSQAGLLPVLEIPYAKYLDCASDMFYEAIIMNWLSVGKQPNGMIIRLQGFGKGHECCVEMVTDRFQEFLAETSTLTTACTSLLDLM